MTAPHPDPNTHQPGSLRRIRLLSRMLDDAIPIPGTSYRIGLDPLLGLLPGGGDAIGFVFSAYIVLEALRFRLPRETLIRMVTNLLLDSVLGTLPFLGDIFDVTWKANARNLSLLEAHLKNPYPQQAADRWFLIGIFAVVILIGIGVITMVTLIINLIWRAIQG